MQIRRSMSGSDTRMNSHDGHDRRSPRVGRGNRTRQLREKYIITSEMVQETAQIMKLYFDPRVYASKDYLSNERMQQFPPTSQSIPGHPVPITLHLKLLYSIKDHSIEKPL